MKIYTRTGDSGQTSLVGGARVRKDDARVDAYGEVDELNALVGVACASGLDADLVDVLSGIQRDLFALGAQLADPSAKLKPAIVKAVMSSGDVTRLEQAIDRFDAAVPALTRFILPGGSTGGATLHLARTVCRRAERRMVALDPPIDSVLLQYVNRLSDLLFVLARVVNHRAGAPETEW